MVQHLAKVNVLILKNRKHVAIVEGIDDCIILGMLIKEY